MYNYYKFGETLFLAAFYLVFGLYFFENTIHKEQYVDDNCVYLKYWAHIYSIYAQGILDYILRSWSYALDIHWPTIHISAYI